MPPKKRDDGEIGTVEDLLTGGLFVVKVAKEKITAHVAEELRRVQIPLRAGDRVKVKRAENDPRRGSIVGVLR